MTKQDLKILERIFTAEIRNALPCQIASKRLPQLKAEGMIAPYKRTLPGRFPVHVEGWALTELGRYTFCQHC
jgi:hypothetical protein